MNKPSLVCSIRLGQESHLDAWLYSMLMDNNLAYSLNPHLIASQEQLAFMVCLAHDQLYLPCSDHVFALLGTESCELRKLYSRAWRIIMRLIRANITDPATRSRIFQFCRYRFKQYTAQRTLIPSRLVKRMTDLLLKQSFSNLADPWILQRSIAVAAHKALMESAQFTSALDQVDPKSFTGSMRSIRQRLNGLEMVRLLCMTLKAREWQSHPPTREAVTCALTQAEKAAEEFLPLFARDPKSQTTILYLCDADGSPFFDIMAIRALLRMGHRVIYAVKDGFFFYAPTIYDVSEDPILEELLKNATILRETSMSKNALLQELRTHKFVVINDGTRERLNLCRVSVTFARAWKEADLILARGWRSKETLLGTSHEFTRDILCFWLEEDGFHMAKRAHAQEAHKFSEEDLNGHADRIIKTMREAHREHKSVIFFSCIIGSLPGQTKTAITLARTFVDDLRKKLDHVLIINPAEHFIAGMDGDDLMFMWERVQRSGQIDVWRFQSFDDIEHSFSLLGMKVPQIWSGKDATYSTGCTKEMQIALDVQRKYPEMQIIGPDPKRFCRRGEYGVGRYFDVNVKQEATR